MARWDAPRAGALGLVAFLSATFLTQLALHHPVGRPATPRPAVQRPAPPAPPALGGLRGRRLPNSQPDAVMAAGAPQRVQLSPPFLTRPYMGPQRYTSTFDHCNPDYSLDGLVCRFDGVVAGRENGVDPEYPAGYSITPGGTDYLYYDGHNGWDYGLVYQPVLAAAPGTVVLAGTDDVNPGFGEVILVDHGNGFVTRYAHLSRIDVGVGQAVGRGQQLAISGNTGVSSGPHLHFGVYRQEGWEAVDPFGWTGAGGDPWGYDVGNLWLTGNPQDPVPLPPTQVTAGLSGRTVTVSWTPPAFNGGSPLTSYSIDDSQGHQVLVGQPSWNHIVARVPAGDCGQTTFTVTASNAVGMGYTSDGSNAVSVPCR